MRGALNMAGGTPYVTWGRWYHTYTAAKAPTCAFPHHSGLIMTRAGERDGRALSSCTSHLEKIHYDPHVCEETLVDSSWDCR